MGCAASAVSRTVMLFNKGSHNTQESRAILERKLYLAKESPEPDFDLSGCHLKQLPSGIFSICKVFRKDYLYLQNNRLRSLDGGGTLSDLHQVKTLNISLNCFIHLPKNICFLTSLTELYLQNNLLESIPDEIKFLQALNTLNLSRNKLKCLNPYIGELKCLRKLNISENTDLTEICVELCHATNLISIELDYERYIMPPSDIVAKGTEHIMRFLCNELSIEYVPPLPFQIDSDSTIEVLSPTVDHFKKQRLTWEEQEDAIKEKESKIHKANQQQRGIILSNLLENQLSLDMEIARVQEEREVDRQKLIQAIQKEEKEVECIVNNFMGYDRLTPEAIQQQLAHEQAEHDRLLEMTRQNYDNVKKCDILKAMEQLLDENYSIYKHKTFYKDNLNNVKQSLLKDTEVDSKLAELLSARDQSREALVHQILEDQDIQKTLVSSLLNQVDSRSWSLNQEISLISSHLAKLSVIEQEKKKMHIMYNYNELLNQRIQLVHVLDDLFNQRNKRREQLLETLNEAEKASNHKTDFWLRSYQKLIDTAPRSLLNIGKTLDPVLANYLLQEGVIHCLPFLVHFLFSERSLLNITQDDLMKCGVSLSTDRENIIKAIHNYVDFKNQNDPSNITEFETKYQVGPSAPMFSDVNSQLGVLNSDNTSTSECVVCMENEFQVVFVPCGHMCCCLSCAQKDIIACPMCRADIERVIKVVIV